VYNAKAYGGTEVQLHPFLTSVQGECEWSASCPRRFVAGEESPVTNSVIRWVGPRDGMDDLEKKKIS